MKLKRSLLILTVWALCLSLAGCGADAPAPPEETQSVIVPVSPSPAPPEDIELPVIMYHHLLKDPERWNDYVVSPECFEADLKYLADRGYKSVTIAELVDWCEGTGALPEKPVLITFDDGQESFEAYALPILEKYDMSAVMAIVGHYSDFYTEYDDHNINYSYLSWNAIGELWNDPHVEFAGHTFNMHEVTPRKGCRINRGENRVDYAAALGTDLDELESRFWDFAGDTPVAFAYPFGAYCDEAREILRERGYKVLFTCDEHVNRLTGDGEELLCLGRFNRASKLNRERFFAKLGVE